MKPTPWISNNYGGWEKAKQTEALPWSHAPKKRCYQRSLPYSHHRGYCTQAKVYSVVDAPDYVIFQVNEEDKLCKEVEETQQKEAIFVTDHLEQIHCPFKLLSLLTLVKPTTLT